PALGALDLQHAFVPDHLDLGVREGALLDDLRRPQLVAPMHDVHFGRVARELVSLLDGGVAAAHDGEHFTLEARAGAPRAVRNTFPGVFLLSRHTELDRGPARRE